MKPALLDYYRVKGFSLGLEVCRAQIPKPYLTTIGLRVKPRFEVIQGLNPKTLLDYYRVKDLSLGLGLFRA